jgi:hypothetical protein
MSLVNILRERFSALYQHLRQGDASQMSRAVEDGRQNTQSTQVAFPMLRRQNLHAKVQEVFKQNKQLEITATEIHTWYVTEGQIILVKAIIRTALA